VKRAVLSNEVRRGSEATWALGIRIGRKDIAIRNKEHGIGNNKVSKRKTALVG
jgi:hypothetical protein